eukprot:CAMPEP_0168509726 /NCGR_PEP_ID=MMETSP0405-20121227/972_1 /TAXON_ID=498012 /ORGANISM="Trichosphaerium sp, Strain Am-I-7 wt" /LENGTH=121 /DNA_ID=CAMNT_0008527289 /DNA_START=143 /DNA_END=508 /DNA_ORIENTATION=-
MSWDSYVTNLTTAGCCKAGLYGLNGSKWAASSGLDFPVKALAGGFASPDGLRATGLKINGDKYFVLMADGEVIMGKKGQGGFVAAKTNTGVVFGLYDQNCTPGQISKSVTGIADYLKQSNL